MDQVVDNNSTDYLLLIFDCFGSRELMWLFIVSHSGNQSAKYTSNIICRQAQCHRSIVLVKGTRCALKFNYRTRRLHRSRKRNTESAGKTKLTVFCI